MRGSLRLKRSTTNYARGVGRKELTDDDLENLLDIFYRRQDDARTTARRAMVAAIAAATADQDQEIEALRARVRALQGPIGDLQVGCPEGQ